MSSNNPPKKDKTGKNVPPAQNNPPTQNVPPAQSSGAARNAPPDKNAPPGKNVPPGKNAPPAKNAPPDKNVPPAKSAPPGKTAPPSKNVPPAQNVPPLARRSSSGSKQRSKSQKESVEHLTDLNDRKGSLPLAQLKEEEEDFFELVQEGDPNKVERFLKEHPSLNINCINYKGLSALQIAVKKENEDMVKLLLRRPDIDIQDASLHAVETGNTDLACIVLDYLKKSSPGSETSGCVGSADFAPDITPLALAAQLGDYKMVRLLLERGHVIEKPHSPKCLCPTCKAFLREAGASRSRVRLNAYKAISNPAYICQVTDDPILYGFLMDRELKECALLDREFRSEYIELAENVREFTVTLSSTCRDTSEIETLMRLPGGYLTEGKRVEYPRLQLAIDNHQKEFVAQSMVQQVLNAHWLGEFRSWPRLSTPKFLLHMFIRLVGFPFICIALITIPKSKPMKKWRAPVNRFLLSLTSYFIFLFMVFLLNYLDIGRSVKGPPQTGLEFVIMCFVIGHLWASFRAFHLSGWKRYLSIPWNWYDMVMQLFFLATFICWAIAYSDKESDESHSRNVVERKFWSSSDATLLHEGLFSIATVLAFGKLAYFCLLSPTLGPLQVSMGKMAIQIGYFLVMCFMINAAFSIPMCRMYAYYDGMKQVTVSGVSKAQLSSFSTLWNSYATLFWGMFGMSPVESADIVIENLTDDVKNPVLNSHDFTQSVGRFLFATYELLMIIALVNTLIAILSNTFQKVVDNADVEFKFARTKLWMYYFDDSSLVPSPFNIVPSAVLVSFCSRYCKAMGNKTPGAKARCNFWRCCYVEYEKANELDFIEYESLMSSLVQRYFSDKEKEEKDEKENED